MTGRTHDLAAFTALSYVFVAQPPAEITLGTLIIALGANFIGALYPDLDKASSDLWRKIPGGTIMGTLLAPLMGGHRMISHSVTGLVVTGILLTNLLGLVHRVVLVDMHLVWLTFMIGYVSHLAADFFTKDGIPLLFPVPINFGFPPFKHWRITTGGRLEKYVVYPCLLLATGYCYLHNYPLVLHFLQYQLH